MRRRARVDENQSEIVSALRELGCSVELLHRVGGGCPDVMAAYEGRTALLEIKNPNGSPRLLSTQREWIARWKGRVAVVSSATEAVDVMRSQTT